MEYDYSSMPENQIYSMDEQLNLTENHGCDYLSMQWYKLISC